MNIAVIGATGWIGSTLVAEATSRGHSVIAIARDTAKLGANGLDNRPLDLSNGDLAAAVAGADVVIDYSQQNFESVLHDYDLVLNSLGADVLEKSIKVLKPGGQLISISGPPTAAFAQEQGLSWGLRQVMRLLSSGIRRKARKQDVRYSFLFMRANGAQLQEITTLIEAGEIRPVLDRTFAFESAGEALTYVEQGRAKGKVIVQIK